MITNDLKKLSNASLMKSADVAIRQERHCKVLVVQHLAEINRRKLHLDWGYPSLWKYCEERLALSPAVIGHRIQVAVKCSEYPALLGAIAGGEMSLTVAGMVAPKLTPDNHRLVLARCKNKTKSQADEILVEYAPRPERDPTIRRKKSTQCQVVANPLIGEQTVGEKKPTTNGAAAQIQPARPEVFNFGFAGSKQLKEKIERLAALKGVHIRTALAELIEIGIDAELNRIDPVRIERRAQKRRQAKANNEEIAQKEDSPASVGRCPAKKTVGKYRRTHVRNSDRRRTMINADERCEHIGPEGNRCSERTGLEVDHRTEVALGGSNHPGNLQILCRAHNFRKTELKFGKGFMASKIAGGEVEVLGG